MLETVKCPHCKKIILCQIDKESKCTLVIKCRVCKEKKQIHAENGVITVKPIK